MSNSISYMPLEIFTLSDEEKERYHPLLPKKYWRCLEGVDPWGVAGSAIRAIAALSPTKPVGLAVASLRQQLKSAELLTLYIDRDLRSCGIATHLLVELQHHLHLEGCRWLSFTYQIDEESTPFYEALLKKLNWQLGELFCVCCTVQIMKFHPYWISKEWCARFLPLAKQFSIIPWTKLSEEELKRLNRLSSQGAIPWPSAPFPTKDKMELLNSLVLQKKGKAIGWMITHRIDSNTVRYSNFYIEPSSRYSGLSIALLAEAIRLQQASGIPFAMLELNLQQLDYSWLRFVKRRILPESIKVERFKRAQCAL